MSDNRSNPFDSPSIPADCLHTAARCSLSPIVPTVAALEAAATEEHGARLPRVLESLEAIIEGASAVDELTLGGLAGRTPRRGLLDVAERLASLGGLGVIHAAWLAVHDVGALELDPALREWLSLAPRAVRILWTVASAGGFRCPF